MIVDCHTHIWESPEQVGLDRLNGRGMGGRAPLERRFSDLDASFERHASAGRPVAKSFVLGFKSRYLGLEIPLEQVAGYVRRDPDKLLGFAGVDPTDLPEAMADLAAAAAAAPGIRGITVSPAAQDFHPADSRAMQVFAEAARREMPVLTHQGLHNSPASKMEFARPVLLDEVARELPRLKLVVAHLGYPWVDECVMLLGRHANVYADIGGILHRPWHAYNALVTAFQYGVMDKLLFGSDFPFGTAAVAIEALYRINQLVTGTNLPTVPRQHLASIVERDTLALLGISPPRPQSMETHVDLLESNEP